MSPSSTILPNRKQYVLELRETSGNYVVEAKLQEPSGYNRNPKSINDLQFNLSTMLGNDSDKGAFVWGRAGFEKSGEDFRLENNSKGVLCLLKGKLVDLRGTHHEAQFDLDDKLQMIEYVDQATKETYHKLAEKNPTPPGRTLALCFDGTSNQFSSKNTNVVKLVELLKKDDPSVQMVYYQTGVGTYSAPGLTTSASLKIASLLDEGVAWYLYQHVIDGYKYLMETYREGDRIALFGFSRGAFTARALAGMLHCVGLLPRHNVEHVPFAYEVYKNAKDVGQSPTAEASTQATRPKPKSSLAEKLNPKDVNPEDFKRTFCVPVRIHFVGVWDTVASVGAFIPKKLPFIEYNPSIMIFRQVQALALDERRGSFIPSIWNHSRTISGAQDVREVWFRGEHSDVGGGSAGPDDSKEHPQSMLSNITLRWMIRQIVNCDTCIRFNYTAVKSYRDQGILEIPPANSPGSSANYWVRRVDASIELDKRDVRNKIYDSIGWSPLWLGLEYIGLTSKPARDEDFKPTTTHWPNHKHPRSIYRLDENDPIFIHGSVIDYMMAHELSNTDSNWAKENYKPRAKWYGYGERDWPGIEDGSTPVAAEPAANGAAGAANPKVGIPEKVQARLKMVRPDTTASWWRIW